jgi:hypothetical protein
MYPIVKMEGYAHRQQARFLPQTSKTPAPRQHQTEETECDRLRRAICRLLRQESYYSVGGTNVYEDVSWSVL